MLKCQPYDGLATYPGCTLPLTQLQLGLASPRPSTGVAVMIMDGWIYVKMLCSACVVIYQQASGMCLVGNTKKNLYLLSGKCHGMSR